MPKGTLYEEVRRLSVNHHIDVYSLSSANHEFADLRPYVAKHKVFDFQPRQLFSSPFGRFNQALRLADLKRLGSLSKFIAQEIEGEEYDVCLVHPCQFESSPSIISNLKHSPTVYYCHEPLRRIYEKMPERPYDDTGSPLRLALNRIDPLIASYLRVLKNTDQDNTRKADIVLVNSKFIQNSVKEIYQVDAKVCYHGIDADWFHPLQEDKQNFVFSVGSLTPLKGFDFLINAIALVPENTRPVLVIASNFQNPPERDLIQFAREKRVELKLEGNISEERLVQLYSQAKITVYASIREPFGLVPVESMSCGTAVVAVRDGGIQETVVDEKTGILVDRDPKQFSVAINRLLSNPSQAEEFGRNGRKNVLQNWTWEKAINTLEGYLFASTKMKFSK